MKGISLSAIVGARTKSALTRVGSLGLALCLVSTPTYATDASIGASTGYSSDQPACFFRGLSAIFNSCTGDLPTWTIPVFTPFTGHHYRVTVRASGNGGPANIDNTRCIVRSLDNTGQLALFEHMVQSVGSDPQFTNSANFQDLVIPRIYVLGTNDCNGPGTLVVECLVGRNRLTPPFVAGGAVLSVDLENLD